MKGGRGVRPDLDTESCRAEIQEDGSIIDTLVITRRHQGGSAQYDWWNRVNANYLRVYLPKGSQLISASGQTVEIYHPPIDYQEQGLVKILWLVQLRVSWLLIQRPAPAFFQKMTRQFLPIGPMLVPDGPLS